MKDKPSHERYLRERPLIALGLEGVKLIFQASRKPGLDALSKEALQ